MSAIERLKAASAKRLGYDTVQTANTVPHFIHISTNAFLLDFAMLGGAPQGLCTMFIGKQHSGKTLMALKTVGNMQKYYNGIDRPKKYVVWVNVGEGIFPQAWAKINGVNTEELILIVPPDGDAAVDLTCEALADPDVCMIVFDAIPGIVTVAETIKSSEDALKPGSVATPLQRMLRKCSTIVAKSYASGDYKSMILINQWRDGISMNPAVKAPRTLPGGKYARHYNSVEIEFYNDEQIAKASDTDIGMQLVLQNQHTFKVHKNKTGNSLREGEFTLIRAGEDAGLIDDYRTVTTYAKKYGLRGGAGKGQWMIDALTGEEIPFDKVDDMDTFLRENPEQFLAMKRLIIGKHRVSQGLTETGWY